jgi:uncharacterized protein (DUF1499 family)
MNSRRRVIRIVVALLIVVVGMRVLTWFSQAPEGLGVRNGRLADLPATPNAVSSQASPGQSARVEPLPLADPPRTIDQLARVVDQLPRSTVIRKTDDYLHVEFRSLVFGFVDDVEFLRDPEQDVIHVRSASRLGYSDLGVNRSRVEQIRQRWTAGQ